MPGKLKTFYGTFGYKEFKIWPKFFESMKKWWSLCGKYWLVKNRRNDDDVKLMKWLMTGGNHGTIDTCREDVGL